MDGASRDGHALPRDAKEYARFCRFRGLFLVDGFDAWRKALKQKGLSDGEIGVKVSAAEDMVRRLEEPSPDPTAATNWVPRP
jgi:hypothetical protein